METDFLTSTQRIYRAIKQSGDGALAQLSLDEMLRSPAPQTGDLNSVATLVQHLHGNMLSRWTDFLTTDGEKLGRDRDAEFEPGVYSSREDVVALWEDGWRCAFAALEALKPADLARVVTIRGQPHTVIEAVHRQIQHYSYHIGQIVLLARWMKGSEWKTLSIAKGQSRNYRPKGIGGEPGASA